MGTMKGLLIRILLVGVGGFLVVWLANSLLVPRVRLDPSRAMKEGTTSVNAATTSSVKTKATQASKGTKRAANAVSAPTSSTEDAALVERALEIPATSTVVREQIQRIQEPQQHRATPGAGREYQSDARCAHGTACRCRP